jgi:hypothetical protein
LLRADAAWLHLVAAVIAIGSKFVCRLDGKHIFNPAGFANSDDDAPYRRGQGANAYVTRMHLR